MIAMTLIHSLGGFPNLWDSVVNSGSIANFQTLFNLITAIVLVPFAGKLVDASQRIIKVTKMDEEDRADLARASQALTRRRPAKSFSKFRKWLFQRQVRPSPTWEKLL